MTRSTLQRTLRRVYATIILVLAISLVAKFVDHIPVLRTSGLGAALKDVYEYLRDMSLLIATGGVAYVANVYQKRASFIDALKEEWRDIIAAKSALFSYTQLERPTLEQYLTTFCKLSETIDNMRSVYQNVGETSDLIGIYPYAPLHDMRRALQTLDPRKAPNARRRGAQPGPRCHPAVVLRAARDLPGGAGPRGAGPSAADLGRPAQQDERRHRARRGAPRTGSRRARIACRRPIRASTRCWRSSTPRRARRPSPGASPPPTRPAPRPTAAVRELAVIPASRQLSTVQGCRTLPSCRRRDVNTGSCLRGLLLLLDVERRMRGVDAARHGEQVLDHLGRQLGRGVAVGMVDLGEREIGLADLLARRARRHAQHRERIEAIEVLAAAH